MAKASGRETSELGGYTSLLIESLTALRNRRIMLQSQLIFILVSVGYSSSVRPLSKLVEYGYAEKIPNKNNDQNPYYQVTPLGDTVAEEDLYHRDHEKRKNKDAEAAQYYDWYQ